MAVVPSLQILRTGGYNPDIISFSTLLAACEQRCRWTFVTGGLDQLAEFAVARTLHPRRKSHAEGIDDSPMKHAF